MSPPSESVHHHIDGSQSYSRDSEFFIDIKPLYLRAETTLFCVPRHYFQASDVFAGMFTLPEVPNAPQEGSSEEHALFLEGIKADELKAFLRVLSSSFTFATGNNNIFCNITDSWLPVLKLASLWQFPVLRERALKYLRLENCMTRLRVSRQYSVKDWFMPALRDLIYRKEPLTLDEMNELGLDFAVKVIALREEARGPPRPISDSLLRSRFEGEPSCSASGQL